MLLAGTWQGTGKTIDVQDDHDLLAAARTLDKAALAEIHDRYYERLYRYIVYRVNDRALAEDLTSEVFVRLLDALHRRKAPRDTLKGWLYRVAANLIADHYRASGQRPTVALHDDLPGSDAGDILRGMITKEALRAALAQLTAEQQSVIALRFGWGMSIREVADTMNKSEGAIKQLQLRALAAIGRTKEQDSQ